MPLSAGALIEDPVASFPSATVACLDPTCGPLPRRRLDLARTRALLERLAAEGVPGLLLASSTGQGHLRSPKELAEWIRCAAGAETGDALPMALLRPEDGRAGTARLLDLCAASGLPVVFLRPGTDLPRDADDARVAESLAPLVADAAERGLAVGLYTIPDVSGVSLAPEAAAALVAGPGGDHVVAVKVTEADYERSTARFLAHPALARLKIVQGWDPHLLRALREGPQHDASGRPRAGVTSGLMGVALHQYRHLLAAAERGEWDEAGAALEAALALFRSMQDRPDRFADLQRAKYVMGLGQPLEGTVEPEQAERVLAALEGLPREADRRRLARSLDLMGEGPFHERLAALS